MTTIFVHRHGTTEQVPSIDRAWLRPTSGVCLWVDLAGPSVPERLILSDTFGFHRLSVEDAMAEIHYPKVEAYDGYLYVILHGIDLQAGADTFATHDVDFFIGPNYLVTVHGAPSRSIAELQQIVAGNSRVMAEGPVSLFHRIVDAMVEHYRPEVDKLEERLGLIENAAFEDPSPALVRSILAEKRHVSSLRRVITPQRDVIARLARREFVDISTDLSFRFRDVYDQLVRITDDAIMFQDRITGILDAHLSSVSNRLNAVMKVLTVVATIFMPLTLLSGLWGMNILLPVFPGGDVVQFWWIFGIMAATVLSMLAIFRRNGWM
jgi:magnesium transporter